MFKLGAEGGYTEPHQENYANTSTRKKSQNINTKERKCIYLNARSIINKSNVLDFMIADKELDIIVTT